MSIKDTKSFAKLFAKIRLGISETVVVLDTGNAISFLINDFATKINSVHYSDTARYEAVNKSVMIILGNLC